MPKHACQVSLTDGRCQVILTAMDMDELFLIWKNYLARRMWERVRAEAEATGDPAGIQAAEHALAALPELSPLDGLRANAALVNVLSVQRWIAMKAAREQGASLEQIGKALGVSRQSAWEFFQRKIAEQQRHESVPDAETGQDEKGSG